MNDDHVKIFHNQQPHMPTLPRERRNQHETVLTIVSSSALPSTAAPPETFSELSVDSKIGMFNQHELRLSRLPLRTRIARQLVPGAVRGGKSDSQELNKLLRGRLGRPEAVKQDGAAVSEVG
jgi:hypothetical protein